MLENPKINIKIKLAALWTSLVFCFLYGDYFELYVPEKVESLLSGDNVLNSPMSLFIASVILAIPSLMVALSLFLKPKLNKILNIAFGFLFALMMLVIGVSSMTAWYGFYVFLAFLETVIASLIIWHAWHWPKKKSHL